MYTVQKTKKSAKYEAKLKTNYKCAELTEKLKVVRLTDVKGQKLDPSTQILMLWC